MLTGECKLLRDGNTVVVNISPLEQPPTAQRPAHLRDTNYKY